MLMRRLVMIIGVLVVIIGLSQAIVPGWWLRMMPSILALPALRIMGLVVLLIGIILVDAAVRRKVGLRLFVLLLGILMLLGGMGLVSSPAYMKDVVYATFLNRPHSSLIQLTLLAGLVRVALGALLIYAAWIVGRGHSHPLGI